MSMRSRSGASLAGKAARQQQRRAHDALVLGGPVVRVELPPDVQDGLRNFVHSSIKTANVYESLLHSNLDKLGFERTQLGLLSFLVNGPYTGKAPGTVLKIGYALKWYSKKENQYVHPWLDDLIKTCTTGYQALYERANTEIMKLSGTVTAPMMEQLLTSMGPDAPLWARDGVVLQWAFALRGHQVPDVQLRNFKRVAGEWTLTLPKDKQSHARALQGKYRDQHEVHRIIPAARARKTIDRMIAELTAQKAPGETPLVETYLIPQLRRWIKAAAATYGWSSEFIEFRGCHCLRHGGATEGRLGLEKKLGKGAARPDSEEYDALCEGVRLITAHRSRTVEQYLRTNEERNASGLAAKQRKELEQKKRKAEVVCKATENVTDYDELIKALETALEEVEKEDTANTQSDQWDNDTVDQICDRLEVVLQKEERKMQTRAGGGAAAGPARPRGKQAAKTAPRQAGRRRQRSEDDE